MNAKNTLKYAEEPKLDDLFVVKKFNEWMVQLKNEPVPKMLFGSLWLEGEVAVMTGDHGVGKSLLAVQIAESIASGRAFGPFEMTAKPQNVLYLNLKLSTKQFKMRYAEEHDAEQGETLVNPYKFSNNLHRVDVDIHCKLPEGYKTFDEILAPLVERLVKKYKAKVVVIDNITMLQRSVYGYRETNTIMKGLHRIKTKRGVSILVLARNSKYGSVRESTTGSSSALFSRFADSVFMLGVSRLDPSVRYVKQLIVHSSERIYNESHVVTLMLKRLGGNFLAFEHHGFCAEKEHHQAVRDNVLWPMIDRVKTLSDDGKKSVREIAAELDIPKSTVQRYLQMWTPEIAAQIGAAMQREKAVREPYDPTKEKDYFPGREEYDQAKQDPKFKLLMDTSIPDDDPQYLLLMREYGIIDNARYRASEVYKKTGTAPKLNEDHQYAEFINPGSAISQCGEACLTGSDSSSHCSEAQPPSGEVNKPSSDQASLTALHRGKPPDNFPADASLNGLKHALNDYGKDIWIEKEDERGKPVIWYSFDSKERKQKHVRDSNGVRIYSEEELEKLE